MKKYNLIYYWQNFLANEEDVSLKPNAYVIKFCIVNKYSYDYYCNWYSFANVEKLISFLKYVVIPSTYITKAFGKDENTIFLDALDKYECMEYLEKANVFDKAELLRKVNREYEKENMLDDLEENMSLNKNEILSMFENIDKNMFMLKRLNTYLNNTLTF